MDEISTIIKGWNRNNYKSLEITQGTLDIHEEFHTIINLWNVEGRFVGLCCYQTGFIMVKKNTVCMWFFQIRATCHFSKNELS